VTGLDFSPAAIAVAEALAAELGVGARFVLGDVAAAPAAAGRDFAFVFASYGVLSWLPDLRLWAEAIRGCLRRGGSFYMVERHPILRALRPRITDDVGHPIQLPYFGAGAGAAVPVTECGSYAGTGEPRVAHYWSHTLGDVVTALATAGLRLRYLHEHPEVGLDSDASPAGGPGLFSVWADAPE
jgi:SAM-dependent methyltransferase